jgi:hypothetical protein
MVDFLRTPPRRLLRSNQLRRQVDEDAFLTFKQLFCTEKIMNRMAKNNFLLLKNVYHMSNAIVSTMAHST